MPRGLGDIPELRLETLNRFVTMFQTPPNFMLMNLFGGDIPAESSTIKWESQKGGREMTPFVPPGAPAPLASPYGIAKHSAEAAYWKEKMYFDEENLNNLRKEGTESSYLAAKQRLARELAGLVIRAKRRREFMFAKMLIDGELTYSVKGGAKITVDYDIPSDHMVTLAAADKWSDGTSRDILDDIIDAKKKVSDDCGGAVDYAICNSTVLKYVAQDPSVLTLLQKSTFGEGDLFKGARNKIVGVNPKVLGSLLDIKNFIVYDEKYEVRAIITGAVTGGSTTAISVANAADFVAGGTLRFHDVSAGTDEEETIASVSVEAGTVTVSTAPTSSFKAGEDFVSMTKSFIPSDKFAMFASAVDGQKIAEYWAAPYGNNRVRGTYADKKEKWDPEGVYVRVQDKGLPVLYQRDAVYVLDVA